MRILLFLIPVLIFAQSENKVIRNGNSDYNSEKFNSAAGKYQKSLQINPENQDAKYNLGNSFYRLDSNTAASSFYQSVINDDVSDDIKSDAYFNYGNTLLKEQKFDESILAYKEALKRDPADMEAKYNLEYARRMLQQQQQQQNQDQNQDQDQENNDQDQNQDQQNKQDKNKDQQNQDQKKQQNQDQKRDQNKDQQQQNQAGNKDEKKEGQQAQPKQQKISKEQAEQMLKNLARREKQILMGQKKEKGEKKKVEKNW